MITTIADLNSYIAAEGYTRGTTGYGRVVLTSGPNIAVAVGRRDRRGGWEYDIYPFATIEAAEAFAMSREPVDRTFAAAAAHADFLADHDGRTGYGR